MVQLLKTTLYDFKGFLDIKNFKGLGRICAKKFYESTTCCRNT